MPQPRYVVGEVFGFLTPVVGGAPAVRPGVSVVVTDAGACHRIVGQFRSEARVPGSRQRLGEAARKAGRELADRLNAGLSR